jgi:hypothetical protein
MRAFDIVVEIGGGEDEATIRRLHHRVLIIATASAMTLHRGQQTQIEFRRSRSVLATCGSASVWPQGKRSSRRPTEDSASTARPGSGGPAGGSETEGVRSSWVERT